MKAKLLVSLDYQNVRSVCAINVSLQFSIVVFGQNWLSSTQALSGTSMPMADFQTVVPEVSRET